MAAALRLLTSELRRQEAQTWKKVIRVISHELNNSLAPVGSFRELGPRAHPARPGDRRPRSSTPSASGRVTCRRSSRATRRSRSPCAAPGAHRVAALRRGSQGQIAFRVTGALPSGARELRRRADGAGPSTLLKNAHESGSPQRRSASPCAASRTGSWSKCSIAGRARRRTVMSNALVPFYSTKRSGTGLARACARAGDRRGPRRSHHDQHAREGGGIAVGLVLPA